MALPKKTGFPYPPKVKMPDTISSSSLVQGGGDEEVGGDVEVVEESRGNRINNVLQKWSDPEWEEELSTDADWRSAVASAFKKKDLVGMRKDFARYAQLKMMELAMNGGAEQTQMAASMFILGQEGHGAVKKMEVTEKFEAMPTDQLQSQVRSMLAQMADLDPEFDVKKLIPVKGEDGEEILEEEKE